MAFWGRIRNSRLEHLSYQFKRWSVPNHGVTPAKYSTGGTRIIGLENPTSFFPRRWTQPHDGVRFFAAPVQVKPKQEDKGSDGPQLNEQIKAEFIRLVTDEGHGIVSKRVALERARKLNLDLVEVNLKAKPPVCKLMDFHKEKYKHEVKVKELAKSKVTLRKGDCKEVRFTGKCEQKDLKIKADTIKRLMDRGYRVKCIATGIKEEQDLGALLTCLTAMIEDVSVVESGPFVEKKQAYVIVRHVKFGLSKKGGGQKAPKAVEATYTEVQKPKTSPSTINSSSPIQSPLRFKEDWRPTESAVESEDAILLDEADTPVASSVEMLDGDIGESKMAFSADDSSNDDGVISSDDDIDGIDSSSVIEQMGSVSRTVLPLGVINNTDSLQPKPLVTSTKAKAPEPSHGNENRYARNNQGSRLSSIKPVESTSFERNLSAELSKFSERVRSQLPNQRQPQSNVNLRSSEENRRLETDASSSRIFKHRMPAGIEKQEKCQPIASTFSTPAYGIFSASKPAAHVAHSVETEGNRDKDRSQIDCTKRPNPSGTTTDTQPPTLNVESNQRQDLYNARQGGWGMFSGDASKLNQGRTSDSQVKVPR